MKKFLLLSFLCVAVLFLTGSASSEQYKLVVNHVFNDTTITTRDEYLAAGTSVTVEPLLNQEITGYEHGTWDVAYVSIDGGNSTIEESYDGVIF